MTDFLDIMHLSIFIQNNVSESGLCVRPQVKVDPTE
jgi:hypothetical protein